MGSVQAPLCNKKDGDNMHSPLPWHIDEKDKCCIRDVNNDFVVCDGIYGYITVEDAEFIVKTVNAKYRGDN